MIRQLFIILFLIINLTAMAQQNFMDNAVLYYQNEQLPEAKAEIDKAVKDVQSSENPYAWYFRGIIYKEIYKKDKIADSLLTLRVKAANSFTKSIELDSNKEYYEENLKGLRFLAVTFFNNANLKLNQHKFELSQKSFELFKSTMRLGDPLMNIQEKEIEYLLALASAYNRIYVDSDQTLDFKYYLQKAKDTYNKVIELDHDNLLANYNTGIIYFNEAVRIIKKIEVSLDILTLREAEVESIELLKKSLPYMETGYEIAPDDENIVEALYEIYYSLNEDEKSERLKKKLEKLKK